MKPLTIAALALFTTSAHAERDPWVARNQSQFEQRWANNPDRGVSKAWREDATYTCIANFAHAVVMGTFSERMAAREISVFCKY